MRQLPIRYYAYGTIGVANHVSDWSAPNFLEDPICSTGSYRSHTIRLFGHDLLLSAFAPPSPFCSSLQQANKAIIVASTKRPAYTRKNLQPTLHSLGQFLGESLNFREFKTRIQVGGNGTHSRLFNPSFEPTHSIIPYQDIVQVVCKNEYFYFFLHKHYTQLVVQLLPFLCLLFALLPTLYQLSLGQELKGS